MSDTDWATVANLAGLASQSRHWNVDRPDPR